MRGMGRARSYDDASMCIWTNTCPRHVPVRFELGRQPANTKLSGNVTVRRVRCRGGNLKFRALRLDSGNFSWGSEATTRKTRVLDVSYNASNNELVRTKTLVKNAIVQVDAAPFKQWYLKHYGLDLGARKAAAQAEGETPEAQPAATGKKAAAQAAARKERTLDALLAEQFTVGRLYACIASRPGQCGRADGYILEGKELEFYLRKMQKKKSKTV